MPGVFRSWMPGRGAAGLAAVLVLLLAGCELTEVTVASGEDRLVVEAVLRAEAPRQVVLLHRSLDDALVRGEPGADVRVRDPGGVEHRLVEAPLSLCAERLDPRDTDSLRVEATCYATGLSELDVVPGESYELAIVTTGGRALRGRTTVPAAFDFHGPIADLESVCALPPAVNLTLDWSPARGAWGYIAAMQVDGLDAALGGVGIVAPARLELTGVAVSELDTTLVVPADVGVFEIGDEYREILRFLQDGFPAGVAVDLVIAAVDRNYVNAVRGGGFNPSGNVRISSVVGDGVGVFGSLVARRLRIQVGSSLQLPPCGAGRAPAPRVGGVDSAVK